MERQYISPALLRLEHHHNDLSFHKTLFKHCGDENKEEVIPRAFVKFLIILRKGAHAKLFMNEIMLVGVSTEKDPGPTQTGSTLSSARAICRFLKNFQKQNILCSLAKTCVESLLRL